MRPSRVFFLFGRSHSLEEAQPFRSKQKNSSASKSKSYVSRRAVVMEKSDKSKYTFLQALSTVRNDKTALRKAKNKERMERKRKEREKDDEGWKVERGRLKKQRYREEGKRVKERERKGGG